MDLKTFRWTKGFATATVVLLGACNTGNGGTTTAAGGSGGETRGEGGRSNQGGQGAGGTLGGGGGQGGQSPGAGGTPAGAGGTDGLGGQGGGTTAAGGDFGGAGGKGGQGGQSTGGAGGSPGGAGGRSGQGGIETPPDAAAGAAGGGGQGGTAPPKVDAADTANGGTGGTSVVDAGGSPGKDASADAGAVGNPRRVLLCDEGNRRVLLVDLQNGTAIWSTLVNDPNKHGDGLRDIQLVGGGRVAASTAKGYVELDLESGGIKKEVSKLTGVESMRRLPNGNTILGGNSDGGVTLQELDGQDGAVTGHKVTFTNYSDFRILRRTPQGTFLMGVGAKLAEVDWDKQTVWEMTIPDGNYVYQGLRLPDKTIAVTAGYGAAILVIDPAAKKVLTTIGGKSQPDAATIVPNFYAGYQILPNGHYVVTNWEGHGGGNGGKGLQLLEYDPTGLLVWKWKQDPNLVSSLHHVIVLDGLDTSKLHDDVNGVLAPVTQ